MMKTPYYTVDFDGNTGPEDAEAGRVWDVIMNHDGKGTIVAQRCVEFDAHRIGACLEACAEVPSELLAPGVWKMHRDHIAAQHESLGKCADHIAELTAELSLTRDHLALMVQCFDVSDSPDHVDYDTWKEAADFIGYGK